jgi:hypothetical protein
VKGNEGNQFEMKRNRGVWSLHFRRRLKTEANFDLEIQAVNDGTEKVESDESLNFRVQIQVVP